MALACGPWLFDCDLDGGGALSPDRFAECDEGCVCGFSGQASAGGSLWVVQGIALDLKPNHARVGQMCGFGERSLEALALPCS